MTGRAEVRPTAAAAAPASGVDSHISARGRAELERSERPAQEEERALKPATEAREVESEDAPATAPEEDPVARIAAHVLDYFYRAFRLEHPESEAEPTPFADDRADTERGMRDAMDLLVAFGERERGAERLAEHVADSVERLERGDTPSARRARFATHA